MGKFAIQLKAMLENCTNLQVSGADYIWNFKLRCTACGESTDKWHTVNPLDIFPMAGGKGKANMIIKCKMCGRSNSVNMCMEFLTGYTSADSEQFKTIVVVEGRGVEMRSCPKASSFALTLESLMEYLLTQILTKLTISL